MNKYTRGRRSVRGHGTCSLLFSGIHELKNCRYRLALQHLVFNISRCVRSYTSLRNGKDLISVENGNIYVPISHRLDETDCPLRRIDAPVDVNTVQHCRR